MYDRLEYVKDKIQDLTNAKFRVESWRLKNDKIVFTNGCFDILHQGHVTYLAQAASLGNRLVVGLNTDDSIRRQGKGENRPVNDEQSRALVLASLGFVEMVILFDGETPIELIKELQPEVLAKGADYDPSVTDPNDKSYIVGSDIVRSNGGEVVAIPFVEGFSSTTIINKIKG